MSAPETILLIEDNNLNRLMATELLERAGLQVVTARDSDNGILLARKSHPSLILMDMSLPFRNGYEATRLLKADPETRQIPVIAFTALAMKEEQAMALESGCSGFISKPIDVDRFAGMVRIHLKEAQNTVQTQAFPGKAEKTYERQRALMELSHDLQGPIRKINRFVETLRKSDHLEASESELLDGIERSAKQMQAALSRTLDMLHQTAFG